MGHPGLAQQFEQASFGRHELAVLLGGDVFELKFLGISIGKFRDHIGLNAAVVDIAAAGGQIFGDRHGHARPIGEPPHRLHQALTKGFLAHQQGSVVVLQGAGENFAGAG